jgi:hypothetical protein
MLAIGIHNLPEGLVTFVGYYNNPRAGVALAVAVALHNIPEVSDGWGGRWKQDCALRRLLAGNEHRKEAAL